VFQVYPLPAYAVAAVWMALGFAWLTERYHVGPKQAFGACAAVLALVTAAGIRSNAPNDDAWGARYAQTVLRLLPKDAVLFVKGDVDLAPIAYFYLIEGWRPDIELYNSRGLVLGNRMFHPLRTSGEDVQGKLRQFIDEAKVPVAFTMEAYGGYARRDHWLYVEVDKSSLDGNRVAIEIPEEALRFFEDTIQRTDEPNAWVAYHQDELRRHYATLLGQRLQRNEALDARTSRHLAALSENYHGAIGIAEGLMASKGGYSAGAVGDLLDRAARLMPADVTKPHKSRFFYLRGALRLDLGDKAGATRDFQTAFELWPTPDNRAVSPLKDLYGAAGDQAASDGLEARLRRIRR
jgi:hypothetical protein